MKMNWRSVIEGIIFGLAFFLFWGLFIGGALSFVKWEIIKIDMTRFLPVARGLFLLALIFGLVLGYYGD